LFHSRYSPKLANFVPSLWCGREGQVNYPEGVLHFSPNAGLDKM